MIARAFLAGLLIAVAEVFQGYLRVKYLNRHVGDQRARQIGVFTGSGIILAIAWFTVPWISAATTRQLLGIGMLILFLAPWLAAKLHGLI